MRYFKVYIRTKIELLTVKLHKYLIYIPSGWKLNYFFEHNH